MDKSTKPLPDKITVDVGRMFKLLLGLSEFCSAEEMATVDPQWAELLCLAESYPRALNVSGFFNNVELAALPNGERIITLTDVPQPGQTPRGDQIHMVIDEYGTMDIKRHRKPCVKSTEFTSLEF